MRYGLLVIAFSTVLVASGPKSSRAADGGTIFEQLTSRTRPATETWGAGKPEAAGRVLRFPTDRGIGRVLVGQRPAEARWWNLSLGWSGKVLAQAQGDVTVPVGMRVRLEVNDSSRRVHHALAALASDDIQHVSFYHCRCVDDELCEILSHLTGLDAVMMGESQITRKGVAYLASLPNLQCLAMLCSLTAHDLAPLVDAKRLEYLNIGGDKTRDATLAILPKLTQVTQLGLGGAAVGEGLQHVGAMENLQWLNLEALRDPDIDLHLKHVSRLTNLRVLSLKNTLIGDGGLYHLRNLTTLEELELFSNPNTGRVTGRGLQNLRNLKNLRRLYLPSGTWTDAEIAFMADFDKLENVNLWSDGLTDGALETASQMAALEVLELRSKKITDAGMEHLVKCPRLRDVTLSVPIHRDGLRHLAGCSSLRRLSIWRTEVVGEDLAELARYPALEELSLCRIRLGQTGAAHVGKLSKVHTLRMYLLQSSLTDDDLAQISRMTSLETLQTSGRKGENAITNPGVIHLAGLPRIKNLYISGCEHVTDEGLLAFAGHPTIRCLRFAGASCHHTTIQSLRRSNPDLEVMIVP
ncbi:MAG TPA: hypothetical protein ENN81_01895 [Phycisphaerales bacterium]|nr:hypothetical protein [Phycisphaerales bacterium]